MKKLKVGNYDINTGSLLEGVIVLCGIKNNPYGNGWLMSSQEALKLIARDKQITGETFRVFLYVVGMLDFENWIYIPQKEIAEYLDLKRSAVSRSIKILLEKEIIIRGDRFGKSYTFRLNAYFGWKGKVKNLDEYRKEQERERIENLKNKIEQEKDPTLKVFSKKYNISLDKIEKFLEENAEVK